MHVAARVGHREEIALAFGVLQPLVAQVCVGVARPRIELQPVCEPFPADGGAQRPLVLQVLFRLLVVAVRAEQRQPSVRIQIPCRHREAAAVAEGVVELLQQVDVAECPVAVAAERIAGADDVAVGVGLELLGVVVAVAEVVLGGAAQHACRGTPAAPPVAQLEKLVEGGEGADALDVAHAEPLVVDRTRGQCDGAAQSAAGDAYRAGPVVERGVVDEVGGDEREVDLAEERRIDFHTVPGHLRVRGRGAPERGGGQRRTAVRFDEDGRARGQCVGQRRGDVVAQHDAVELRALDTDFLHRARAGDFDPFDVAHAERILRRVGQCGVRKEAQ